MLLYDASIIFYHPLDDLVESTESLTWTNEGSRFQFVPGVLTSGLQTKSGESNGELYYASGPPYDSLSQVSGITCAVWVSGFLGGDSDSREIGIGTFTSTSLRNGAGLYKGASSGSFSTISRINDVWKFRTWTPSPSSDTDWHLFIVDTRYETSGWRHRVSLDGSSWIDLGVDDRISSPNNAANPYLYINDHVTGPKIVIDETVLWGGNDLFTNQELLNLYALYNTYNTTMDQYTNIFGTPANSGVDCFIHGKIPTSGNTSLYIPGQKEVQSINLFTEGFVQNSGNIDLYISGTPPIISSSIDLYIVAPTPVSGDVDLYISGPLSISGNIDHFIDGHQLSSGNVEQYLQGYSVASGNTDLYMFGVPWATISLYTIGPVLVNDNVDHFTVGHLPISGNFTLFTKSGLEVDAFVAVSDNNPSGDLDLFTHGVPSGESTTFYSNDTITLFINDSGENATVDSDWLAFTRVADAISDSYSGTWQSFVRGGNVVNDNIDLYINSHASGESPRGISTTGLLTTFINGRATQEGDESLLSDGYSVIDSEFSGFAKIHLGLSGTLNLYTSGSIPIIQPSAILNLSIFGILDTTSGSCTLYAPSQESINGNIDSFIFGVQGLQSGNCLLYLEVTDIGLFNQTNDLYTHGF